MLKKFDYEGHAVRTIVDEQGKTWIPGIDIFEILGYSKNQNLIDILDDDEKKLTTLPAYSGQDRQTWIINEGGFYHVVLTSTKPEAKKFRRWITDEVIPSIRKAGIYTTEQAQEREFELQELTKLIQTKKALLKINLSNGKDLKTEIAKLESRRDTLIQNFNPQLKFDFISKQEEE